MRSTYHRIHSQLLRPPVIACACVVLLWTVFCAGASASTLVVSGAGDGHGVGMSQDGALGYAQHGWTYQAILAHYYSHTAIGQAPAGANVRVLEGGRIHTIALETYVRGVVSAEVPASWPLAALQAQAVASRTYALTAHAGGSKFDVYADTRSQVYRGVAAETPQTDTAITDTAGQVLTYEGHPAITYFFASSGGSTENVENAFPGSAPEPWLHGVADSYETKSSSWKLNISFATAAARLKGLVKGTFSGIEVLKRGVSPRIVSAAVLGTRGATPVSGPELAGRLGLSSTWAYFSVQNGKNVSPQPDHSSQSPAPSPAATGRASATTPAVTSSRGGAQGPEGHPSLTRAGGAVAG
ncbi:MAG TPA: SpoIID/LytB domain-containing protein [Solirubrobacteraceae bacterium]|jgi:stage II sporulation protein D